MASAKSKLLAHFQANVGKPIDIDTLSKVAETHDWARSIRTLRQEGHDVDRISSGEFHGSYLMKSLEKKEGNIRGAIDAKTRYRILHRDDSTCRRCGRRPPEVKVNVDHMTPVDWGGGTTDENLWTLCVDCNLGKKHWFQDADPEEMKKLLAEKSAYRRLEMFFTMHPNETIDVAKLDLIAGIRDWERTLRSLRTKSGMKIEYVRKQTPGGSDGYVWRA